MKRIIQIFTVALIFAACNSRPDLNTNKDVILVDTSKMYRSNIMTDTGSVIQTTTVSRGNTQNAAAVANRNNVNNNTRPYSTGPVRSVNRNGNGSVARSSNNGNTSRSGQTTTVTRRRRGWSHAAKDAAIGGVGGAVTGAIISKHKGKGAIIGGVVGAAGGYILGHSKDKREGRY